MNKKIMVLLVLGMMFISMSSAQISELETLRIGDNLTAVQSCASCSFNNVTFILLPNFTTIQINQAMTKDGSSYTLVLDSNNFTISGKHIINGIGDINGVNTSWNYKVKVNTSGVDLDTPKAILYFILLLGVFFVLLFSLWGSVILPLKNPKGSLGEIIDISYLKYAKVGLMFITFTLFVWEINLLLSISNSFNVLTQYNGFFTMIFQILMNLTFPLFIIMIIVFFLMGAKDLQLKRLLERGIFPQ